MPPKPQSQDIQTFFSGQHIATAAGEAQILCMYILISPCPPVGRTIYDTCPVNILGEIK